MKKDSEVQPPNPVPPESGSNEVKMPQNNIESLNLNNEKSVNDVLLPEKLKEEAADTISDSHPKNLKSKLNEAKIANEINDNKIEEKLKPPPANEENKAEKIKLIKQQQLIETMKQHGEEQKELMQEQKEILNEIIKTKKEMNVEKPKEPELKPEEPTIDANKHQQLIDTIKQHGKEQKELMKEQKEILDEIKELQHNKDTDSLEAKKLAVESIKQIADMAIKSIGGVTEKPVGQPEEDKKDERLEKLTNEAVKEIAKKVVETIEAIQEIKENPEVPKPVIDGAKVDNKIPQPNPPVIPKVETKHNVKAPVKNLIGHDTNQNEGKHNQGNVKRELLSNNALNNEIKQIETVESKIDSPVPSNRVENEVKQNVEYVNIAAPIVIAKHPNEIEPKNVAVNNIVVEKENLKDIQVKPHSHSPDEPQSYILGEDSQIKNPKNKDSKPNENVPLAVAMSDQAKLENIVAPNAKLDTHNNQNVHNHIKQNVENSVKENTDNSQIKVPKIDNLARQKRDVVDCTQTVSLEPADRNLCKALNLIPIENSIDVLPKIDLNDRLSKMPLHLNIGRSLKSYNKKRKR